MFQKFNNLPWGEKRKKLIIGTLSILFVIIFSSSIFFIFFNKPATCIDTKQNQNEEGVDCGGVCTSVCRNNIRTPVVKWVRIFEGKAGFYSALASIENSNDAIVSETTYSFKLYDASGAVIAEKTGQTFIPKRKDFLVYEANIDPAGKVPTSVYFSFTKELDWKRSDYEEPKLDITKQILSDDGKSSRLDATVNNPNIQEVTGISFIATLYDDENNAIDASRTFLDSLAKYRSAPLVFTWPRKLPVFDRVCGAPVDVALIIDRSGSMNYLGSNPPQPLTDVKTAAEYFIDQLNKNDQASIISFGNEASIDNPLSKDLQLARKAIVTIEIKTDTTQNTNIADGLLKAKEELDSYRHLENSGKVVILLTDGVATRPLKQGDTTYPETAALSAGAVLKGQNTTVFSIGLGKDVNQDFLKKLSTTPENAYFAPSAGELKGIYQSIATKICKKGTSRIEITPSIPLK